MYNGSHTALCARGALFHLHMRKTCSKSARETQSLFSSLSLSIARISPLILPIRTIRHNKNTDKHTNCVFLVGGKVQEKARATSHSTEHGGDVVSSSDAHLQSNCFFLSECSLLLKKEFYCCSVVYCHFFRLI